LADEPVAAGGGRRGQGEQQRQDQLQSAHGKTSLNSIGSRTARYTNPRGRGQRQQRADTQG
ncbi:MAG TPA: hypothetical protein VJB14_15850, partial [Planctomycetota bacterium]|nr:hypothetical protein [Planctomycetota bacterium]